jgi:succinoglycan biosynthesis transport protein ExoP
MDILYLLRALLKKKWIIIGSAVLAAFVAWFFTRNEPKKYRSSTRISTGFAVAEEIRLNDNFSIFDADVKFNNAISTMNSPSVVSLLSYKLILHDLQSPSPFRSLSPAQQQSPVLKGLDIEATKAVFSDKLASMSVLTSYKPEEKKLLELLALYQYDYKALSQDFNIYQVPRTDYLQIDYISENPELSAFAVNNLYTVFLRYYQNVRSAKSQESIDTLQSMMEKKKQYWDDKSKLLKGEDPGGSTTEITAKFDLITDLEKTLTAEKNKQTEDYYALRKVNQQLNSQSTPSKEVSPANNSNNNNEELVQARKAMNEAYADYLRTNDKTRLDRYNQLKTEYYSKYAGSSSESGDGPAIVSPGNRNALTEKKNDLEVDVEASNAKIEALNSRIASLKASTAGAAKGSSVETLIDEVKLAEKDYFDAKQKYSNALDQSSSSINNFRQTQVAQPAIDPEPSKRKAVIGMAGALALIVSVLVILLTTYLDSSVKTPIIFAKKVNLKLISIVNFMNLKNRNLKDMVAGVEPAKDLNEKFRHNIFRESIRKLRYEIEISGHKIFLFTSTQKGQGKTTLIQALAYSMSLSKKKILIIDTNFCNNDLTVQLDANPILEKITASSGQAIVAQIQALSKDIGSEGSVFAIGSEGGDYTPSEILPRENILNHLNSLKPEFDYIFLEGPPLNDFSDSKELMQYVDSVVAVFSALHVIKQIDKESIKFLKELNGKFCGSVLNMIDLENVNVI